MSRMRDLLIKRRSEVTPLIHWDFSGKSNADAETIVEDLTGNGYNLELKDFSFDNTNGYNGYPTDFRKWDVPIGTGYDTSLIPSLVLVSENTLTLRGTIGSNGSYVALKTENVKAFETDSCIIKVSGLPEGKVARFYNYNVSDSFVNLENGLNIVDTTVQDSPKEYYIGYYGGRPGEAINIVFEIYPQYPDQLVFKSSQPGFGQCTKDLFLPISRGYSYIVKCGAFSNQYLIGKGRSNANNIISIAADFGIYSYGEYWKVPKLDFPQVMWSSSSQFMGTPVKKGSVEDRIDNILVLGTTRPGDSRRAEAAIEELYLFDRDLTQSQIEKFISENMIPLPEVYYDVAKQGTLNDDTTKDKLIDFSGNGNHGTLNNFIFDPPRAVYPNFEVLGGDEESSDFRITAEKISDTVFHITKFGPGCDSGALGMNITNFNGFGYKFVINIKGVKEGVGNPYIRIYETVDGTTTELYKQTLNNGSNTVDLTNINPSIGSTGWIAIYWSYKDYSDVTDFWVSLSNYYTISANGWGYYPLDSMEGNPNITSSDNIETLERKSIFYGHSTGVILYSQRKNIQTTSFIKDITVPEFRIKVTGLTKLLETQPTVRMGIQSVFVNSESKNKSYSYPGVNITKDGVYTIPSNVIQYFYKQEDVVNPIRLLDIYIVNFVTDGENSVIVEFLPTDSDCLRFNHNYRTCVNINDLTHGFKTVFMVCEPEAVNHMLYDQRPKSGGSNYFGIYTQSGTIAYTGRNTNGFTYINGTLNIETKVNALLGIKQCITIVNNNSTDETTETPYIGNRALNDEEYASTMKFYKFLGFKEALSEKQIKMVIEKYGLQVD